MARSVLIAALALALSGGVAVAQEAASCNGASYVAASRLVEATASPLFGFLTVTHGAPQGCAAEDSDGVASVSVGFAGGTELRLSATPEIEVSSIEAVLGADVPPLSAEAAAAVLERTEIWMTGPEGCGIGLDSLNAALAEGGGDVTVEGEVCNCRATITRQDGAVRGIGMSSAC